MVSSSLCYPHGYYYYEIGHRGGGVIETITILCQAVRAASPMGHANWKMILNANIYCVKHRPACEHASYAHVPFCHVWPQEQVFSSCSSKVTKNNTISTQVPNILTGPRCQIWTPRGCLLSCLCETHSG